MWVAIVLACSNQMAISCQVLANKDELFYNQSLCKEDASKMANYLVNIDVFAVPICIKVGESA
tara:strand:- start:900 stop:1088 length:189 start_codon:yes stop_codon:yes gene_type:complete